MFPGVAEPPYLLRRVLLSGPCNRESVILEPEPELPPFCVGGAALKIH